MKTDLRKAISFVFRHFQQVHSKGKSPKPYFVNLTFWEDRPRLDLNIESDESSSSDDEDPNGNQSGNYVVTNDI